MKNKAERNKYLTVFFGIWGKIFFIPHLKKMFMLLILIGSFVIVKSQNTNLLIVDDKPFFASGMNLAWINFANDLSYLNGTTFSYRCKQLSAAGGNTLRWWLHVNGTSSPKFTNDTVSGISTTEINNLKKALDTAQKYNIKLVLCLWSFDMLQSNAGSGIARNKKLVEDSVATAAYIRNALTPLVNAVMDHPAILCWEVCNEPEGMSAEFGWSTERTTMAAIQAFTNRIAGAIHRIDPKAKVSNGSWNIKVLTDVNGMYNYYRDDRLIAAGKDSLGTLDFYMVHYYNAHFGISESPFHHPKSYWNLDKPLVIAEFSAWGMWGGQLSKPLSPIEAYRYAMENGYAGALSWTMTAHDGNGGLEDASPALEYLVANYADSLQLDASLFNFSPQFLQRPDDIIPTTRQPFQISLNIKKLLTDPDDSVLTIQITSDNSNLVTVTQVNDSTFSIDPSDDLSGITHLKLTAIDGKGKKANTYFTVGLYDSTFTNLALYRKANASDHFTNYYPFYAIDGKTSTGWWSYQPNAEFIVEFEKNQTFNKVILNWSDKYARKYNIDISNDGKNWQTIHNELNGKTGTKTIKFNSISSKYLRINCLTRSSNNGYLLNELEVYYDSTLYISSSTKKNICVYPNPARDYLNILFENNENTPLKNFSILDVLGKVLLSSNNCQSKIDVRNIPSGAYFLSFTTMDDKKYLIKFFKK